MVFNDKPKYDTRQTFRLSADEKAKLIEEANKRNLDISSFIRFCINQVVEKEKR